MFRHFGSKVVYSNGMCVRRDFWGLIMSRGRGCLFIAQLVLSALLCGLPLHFALADSPIPGLRVVSNVSYGQDPSQKLDVGFRDTFSNVPVVIFVHGGGWDSGDKSDVYQIAGFFLRQGFAVVAPNYRLAQADVNLFPAAVEDLARVVAWTVQNASQFGADPRKLILGGHSAGAHLAALVAYGNEGDDWLTQFGFDHVNMPISGFIGSAGIYDFDVSNTANATKAQAFLGSRFGAGNWNIAEPVNYASAGDPPALLITGDQDTWVNTVDPVTHLAISNSQAMDQALRNAGVASQLVLIAGGDHSAFGAAILTDTALQNTVTTFIRANTGN